MIKSFQVSRSIWAFVGSDCTRAPLAVDQDAPGRLLWTPAVPSRVSPWPALRLHVVISQRALRLRAVRPRVPARFGFQVREEDEVVLQGGETLEGGDHLAVARLAAQQVR
jgi:hypothetical protein